MVAWFLVEVGQSVTDYLLSRTPYIKWDKKRKGKQKKEKMGRTKKEGVR